MNSSGDVVIKQKLGSSILFIFPFSFFILTLNSMICMNDGSFASKDLQEKRSAGKRSG